MKSIMYKKALLSGALLMAAGLIYPLWIKPVGSATPHAESGSGQPGSVPRPPYLLELHFTRLPHYHITHWAQPQRIYIDLDDTPMTRGIAQPVGTETLITGISFAPPKVGNQHRVQIDFSAPVQFKTRIQPTGQQVDLILELTPRVDAPVESIPVPSLPKPVNTAKADPPSRPTSPPPGQDRGRHHWIIAIDAGHGGKDTGALGPTGIQEKDVVLAIARRLADFVRAEPDMKPVMIRTGDQFVDLRQRVTTARDAKADLFVSLHADAYINDQARGSSVFTLSDRGATSEAARWLADRENAALVGGVKLGGDDPTLASVLLDLSQDATLDASDRVADKILHELKKGFHVHHQAIQKAGFVVLKSPDIPSLLVETAFISNPEEELNLISPRHQTQIARALFKGIRASFSRLGHSSSLASVDAGSERK